MLTYLKEYFDLAPAWLLIALIGVAVVSYALGCFNGAVMISRGVLKDDIRKHGSGNGGLTNFCRIHGGFLSVFVILIDMLKAVASMVLAWYIFDAFAPELVPLAKYLAGLCCILGHMFPCNFQFRGGKGVLSSGAMAILIDWRLAMLIWGCFLICSIATRYVSLGSCVGALAFPFGTYFIFRDPILTVLGIVMGGLVIFKHRGNIVRLLKGTESKFVFKWGKGKKEPALAETEQPEASNELKKEEPEHEETIEPQ